MGGNIFEFKVIESKKGIYINLKGEDRLVYPYELYGVLWNCDERRNLCKEVEARFQIFSSEVWGYYFDYKNGYYNICYNRDNFINSALQSLKELCDAILKEEETSYRNIKMPHAERLEEELGNIVIPRNYSQVFRDELKVNEFHFNFIEEYSCDTGFELIIGNRLYRSCLSDWSNDFNTIRYELEGLMMYGSSCSLNIYFEDSPNTIMIRSPLLHGNTKNDNIVKVTFTPDSFVGGPIICGWCNLREVLRSIYLGFLRLFISDSTWFDDGTEVYDWNIFRLACYNKIQSCIVEDYILGISEMEYTYRTRQRIVNSVDEMMADFKELEHELNSITL